MVRPGGTARADRALQATDLSGGDRGLSRQGPNALLDRKAQSRADGDGQDGQAGIDFQQPWAVFGKAKPVTHPSCIFVIDDRHEMPRLIVTVTVGGSNGSAAVARPAPPVSIRHRRAAL